MGPRVLLTATLLSAYDTNNQEVELARYEPIVVATAPSINVCASVEKQQTRIWNPPAVTPAAPIPEMARPTIRVFESAAKVEIADPTGDSQYLSMPYPSRRSLLTREES